MKGLERIEAKQKKLNKWLPKRPKRQAIAPRLIDGLIDWARPLMQPYRYKCLYGGRGSAKSWSVADALLIHGVMQPERILCAREFQNSIQESVHHLLSERVAALGLDGHYIIQRDRILGTNGTEFIFKGLRHNVQSIKSMSGITKLWIEEAQTISANSWQILVPTIREPGSEIWATFNPEQESDVIYQELVARSKPDSYVERVNWDRNPYFPEVLDIERREMQRTDPDAYQHIWEGGFWEKSDAQILAGKWRVDEFIPLPSWDGPYYGADFGFAQDPTTLIRCWIGDRILYVERESYGVGLELDHTAERWKADVPECDRYVVRADSARPESISYLKRHGIPRIEAAPKWAGSVEDGIAFLRSFDAIVIHPTCKRLIEEMRLYRYKTDRYTGDVLPVVIDAHNHGIDALRYALAPLITASNGRQQHAPIPTRPQTRSRSQLRRIF